MKTTIKVILALCLGVVLQATLVAQQPPHPPKRQVGVPADAKLFNGKWYKVYFEKISWNGARDKCRTLGGQLVVIPDEPTWAFIKNLTPAQVWLGASDEKIEGVWMWVDNTPVSFSAWHPGSPDNHQGNDHYLGMFKGGWHDLIKSDKIVAGYICEWKAK